MPPIKQVDATFKRAEKVKGRKGKQLVMEVKEDE
jgi:hypothetical protein